MKPNDCKNFRERLADLLEGRASDDVVQHVAGCVRCELELKQLRTILGTTEFTWHSAPTNLVDSAKSLMPTRAPIRARLLGSSLAAGARSVEGDAQVVVGNDETSVRLMVSETESGWEVFGRLPSSDWTVEPRSGLQVDSDGFRITAQDLATTGFRMVGPSADIDVPALSELLDHAGQ